MPKRAVQTAFDGPDCPCCLERTSFTGIYKPSQPAAELCSTCVEIPEWTDALPPFQWPTTVAEIEESTESVLVAAEANLAAVAAADPPTFATVIKPLMLAPNYKTNVLVCQSKFLQHGSPNAELREVAESAGKKFAAFKAKSRTRADIFAKVQEFAATAECAALATYERHFVDALLRDFKRGGLALSADDRTELQRLLDADSAACSAYGSNLGNDKTKLLVTPEELDGLPAAFIDERKEGDDGKVALTLKYPDLIPVTGQCAVEATRKALMEAREKAYGNNLELMAEGVGYRKQTAALLGYQSWAHFVIETRMAGSPETVTEFLGKIRALAKEGAADDIETLRCAKVEHLTERGELPSGGAASVTLEAWDSSFYHNRVLKMKYGVDTEAVRSYFPLNHVVATTLQIYQELLALTFSEVPAGAFSRWHEDVRLFVVREAEGTNALVGHFYLDLHPREGKYGHAAIFHLLKRNGQQCPTDASAPPLSTPHPLR